MKAISLFLFACIFSLCLTAQTEDGSLTIVVVPNQLSYGGINLRDADGNSQRGDKFVLSGYIYPQDYFDQNCPTDQNCGINADGSAEQPDAVIGTWTFRGFTAMDQAEALANGGAATFSNQIFKFSDDFADCPGCSISLDGNDVYGGAENTAYKKVIIGATTEAFRSMRGEAELMIFQQPENENATGGFNMAVTFFYTRDR